MNRIRELSDFVQSQTYCLTLSCTRFFFSPDVCIHDILFQSPYHAFFLMSNECEFFSTLVVYMIFFGLIGSLIARLTLLLFFVIHPFTPPSVRLFAHTTLRHILMTKLGRSLKIRIVYSEGNCGWVLIDTLDWYSLSNHDQLSISRYSIAVECWSRVIFNCCTYR